MVPILFKSQADLTAYDQTIPIDHSFLRKTVYTNFFLQEQRWQELYKAVYSCNWKTFLSMFNEEDRIAIQGRNHLTEDGLQIYTWFSAKNFNELMMYGLVTSINVNIQCVTMISQPSTLSAIAEYLKKFELASREIQFIYAPLLFSYQECRNLGKATAMVTIPTEFQVS